MTRRVRDGLQRQKEEDEEESGGARRSGESSESKCRNACEADVGAGFALGGQRGWRLRGAAGAAEAEPLLGVSPRG